MRQAMRPVYIFTVQRPIRNKTSVKVLSDAFGTNIPHYLLLEGGDYNGPQYLFCVDRNTDFEAICEKYKYRYYPAYKFEVEEEKFNREYQIIQTYFNKEQPYMLEKYNPTEYESD